MSVADFTYGSGLVTRIQSASRIIAVCKTRTPGRERHRI